MAYNNSTVRKPKYLEVVVLLILICYYGVVLSSAADDDLNWTSLTDERVAAGFISIDCGMAINSRIDVNSRIDDDRNLRYSSDAGFIDTGTNMEVNDVNLAGSIFSTLRSFPDGNRNCYTLKPMQGKNSNYLIRAQFSYGNYDGLNTFPVFDLYIDVHFWATVQLSSANSFYDLVYAPPDDVMYVCLVKTGSTTPFISSLELRPLNISIYNSALGALRLIQRMDAGLPAGNSPNYYCKADDPYDRIWGNDPAALANWDSVRTNSSMNSTNTDSYKLPPSVLQTAAIPLPRTFPLRDIMTYDLHNTGVVYVFWHFAEVEKLATNDSRELTVSMTGYFQSGPISPKYLQPLTIVSPPTKLNGLSLEFFITKTTRSSLPPILNAYEYYEVVDLSASSATDQNDVNAMMNIKMNFSVPKSWQGDPCLPYLPWDGLSCSSDDHDSPRITSLNLAHSGLAGDIPHSLTALTSLTYLNLSYNSFTGAIPDFLAELPYLRTIDLKSNNLTGAVPVALTKRVEDGSLYLSLQDNPYLCISNSCKKKNLKKILVILGATTSIIVAFVAVTLFYILLRKRQAGTIQKSSIKSENRAFKYIDVVNMTNNFRKVIGRGGSGSVYQGSLTDGTLVAVKILNPSSTQSLKQFCTEAQLLMRVHHRNLVSLVGYCEEGTNMALIYEYVSNGNLQKHLSEKNVNISCWKVRLQIAIDTAQGLEYMHNGCKPPIIHRDMKSSNILLDDELNAKISDFGISRPFLVDTESVLPTDVVGTYGYVDPEYWGSGILSVKSDVYSFGVVLLELITGRPCIIRGTENNHITSWVTPMLERGDIYDIVDKRLQGNFSTHSTWKALEISMACVSSIGIQRPSMTQVLADLKDCFAIESCHEIEGNLMNYGNAINQAHGNDMVVVDTDIQMVPTPR